MSAPDPEALLADTSPVDEVAIRQWRLSQPQKQMDANDVAGLLLFDLVNIRYANGSRNMQVWTMHNFCCYALILNGGPSVMIVLCRKATCCPSIPI